MHSRSGTHQLGMDDERIVITSKREREREREREEGQLCVLYWNNTKPRHRVLQIINSALRYQWHYTLYGDHVNCIEDLDSSRN